MVGSNFHLLVSQPSKVPGAYFRRPGFIGTQIIMNKKKTIIILISDRLTAIFGVIYNHFFSEVGEQYRVSALKYISYLNRTSESRGRRETLKHAKEIRLCFTRWLSGEPILGNEVRVSRDSTGYPIILNEFKELAKSEDTLKLRFILTVLNITRGVVLSPKPSYSTIESTWEGSLPQEWYTFRSAILRTLGIGKRKKDWRKFHLSTKSGPNGQAIMTSMRDFTALPDDLKQSIIGLGGENISRHMNNLAESTGDSTIAKELDTIFVPDDGKREIRRISTFGDMEGKTREIAVFDYWSQTVLKPVHDHLMKILSKIPEDCTSNQTGFKEKLPKMGPYYSMDLTSATDRLPAVMQKDILGAIIGNDAADHWYNIMVGYDFQCPDQKRRKYATGQAMGAYSSWPAMAIQHHCIVWLAAKRIGKSARGKYVLLGDDIVIADHDIAVEYRKILQTLDVPISVAKTHTSLRLYEFAKRWVFKGSEITTFPTNAILESWKRYYLLQNALEIASNRGYVLPDCGEKLVLTLYKALGKFSQGERTFKLLRVFDILINKKIKTEDRTTLLADAMEKFWPGNSFTLSHWSNSSQEYLRDVTRNLSVNTWLSSQTQLERIQSTLENIQVENTRITEVMWESHPLAQVISQIQQARYETNLRELEHEDPLEYLKSLAETPFITTKVFSMRSAQARLLSQSRFVKFLIDSANGNLETNKSLRDKLLKKRKKQGERQRLQSKKVTDNKLPPDVIKKRQEKLEVYRSTVLYKARQVKTGTSY